jgi:hypothetical protein
MSNGLSDFDALFKAARAGDRKAFWDLVQHKEFKKAAWSGLATFRLGPVKGAKNVEYEETLRQFEDHLSRNLPSVQDKEKWYAKAYIRSAARNFYLTKLRRQESKNLSLDDPGLANEPSNQPWPEKREDKVRSARRPGHLDEARATDVKLYYQKLPERIRRGAENAASAVQRLHEDGRRYFTDEKVQKFSRTHDVLFRLEKDLSRIWGSDVPDPLRVNMEKEQHRALGEVMLALPDPSARNLIFENLSDWRAFLRMGITSDRLLFDVLAKAPEMRKGKKYRGNGKIALIMMAIGDGHRVNPENLRQYQYRVLSKPSLYSRIVSRIYKLSFKEDVNFGRPFDIAYQNIKEGHRRGIHTKEDVEHARQARDHNRKMLKRVSAAS